MNQDDLLIARMEDKADQADRRYMMTWGTFLDSHQRKLAEDFCRSRKLSVRAFFYGGYEEAERCIPVFLPDYAEEEDACGLLRVVRVTHGKGGKPLSHRDYLGSLLALGIDREVTGDILVRGEKSPLGPGADILVLEEIADFIEGNYSKAGRTELKAEILPVSELHRESADVEEFTDSVASLRLDSIVASVFRLSRAKAGEAVRRGLVSVNSCEALKTDMEIHPGDKVTLRGKGRARLLETAGVSRKGRIRIRVQKNR